MEDHDYTDQIKYLSLIGERGAPLLKGKAVYVHQKESIQWMQHREKNPLMGVKGGILSLSPGLGKTLTYIIHSLLAPKNTSTLIIVPKSLINETVELFEKFFGNRVTYSVMYTDYEVEKLETSDLKTTDFFITTYETLTKYSSGFLTSIYIYNGNKIMSYKLPSKRNFSAKGYKLLYATHWDRIIMEESHTRLVNTDTLQYKSVMALSAEYRWAITGSVINNKSSDFWATIHCLGYVFIDTAKKWNRSGKDFFESHNLASLLWVKTYEQCNIKMPDLDIQTATLRFTPAQTRNYNSLVKKAQTLISSFEESTTPYANVLVGFLRLREYCSNIDQKAEFIRSKSGSEKCIIFSSFIDSLEKLAETLGSEDCTIITSKTPKREARLSEFESSDRKYLLATYKVCGVGLNLQYITKCFFLEPFWNDSTHKQALHRCWRIGQTDKVLMYKLVMKGSLEENIYKLCSQKKEIQDSMEKGHVTENISKLDVQSIKVLLG